MVASQGPTSAQRAMEYYKHASEFTDAYEKLSRADANLTPIAKDLQHASVKLLIVGHALELTLKGWLVLQEGTPVSLTRAQRRALKQAGQIAPTTLKDYGHDLVRLAVAAIKYCSGLQPYLDRTITMLGQDGTPLLDVQGQPRKKSILEHLNSSYWADGARQYEYPEASEAAEQQNLAFLSPLDQFAKFVSTCRQELLTEIMEKNDGTVPQPYRESTAF